MPSLTFPPRKKRAHNAEGCVDLWHSTSHLRARNIIAQTKKLMKGVRQPINLKQTSRDIHATPDAHCGANNTLAPLIIADVAQVRAKECTHSSDGERGKSFLFSSYYPNTAEFHKYGHVALSLVAVLILREHRGQVFSLGKGALSQQYSMESSKCEANVRSGMFL